MKKLILAALTTFSVMSVAHAAELKFEGLYISNAGLLTESLLSQASSDDSIKIDTSVYTITKVSREDRDNRIECSRHHFGGTPAQYYCTITEK